jgi:outer membrane receptor protein involved in Fe transport
MSRFLLAGLFLLLGLLVQAQGSGIITGNVLDEKKKALEGATIQLSLMTDSLSTLSATTDKDGDFTITRIPFGLYRLRVTFVGLKPVTIDSLHFRAERSDFNLNDIILKPSTNDNLDEIIIYAEKPLVQSKDGNITFNASESALSAGSSASDLLGQVPLVAKDPDGKITVRGKEPKILIDDKPVELNLQQLQDLLESMPGSSVEKIEVMTNPPPQYANEQGGVINIVTKKGKVGMGGRLSINAGTRGQYGGNANFNYRKQGLVFNITAGAGYNHLNSDGYSIRNRLSDASKLITLNDNNNRNLRPNGRINADYDIDKKNALSATIGFNLNSYDNFSGIEYENRNSLDQIYQLRLRDILSTGSGNNLNTNLSYTHKAKKPGQVLRVNTSWNHSSNESDRNFMEEFLNPDRTPRSDSMQQQLTDSRSGSYTVRLNYDLPLTAQKTFLSVGGYYTRSSNYVKADASYFRKLDESWKTLDALTNEFRFYQNISNIRASLRQVLKENFSVTGGLSLEQTRIRFDLMKLGRDTSNSYWSVLPFATVNRNWKEKLNLTLSYRRTTRRPGIGELNPTIDFSDAYNIRFGNPGLIASLSDNFDLVLGKTKANFYSNLGLGYNIVNDIFSQVRTLVNDTTFITWENISGRKEYELSTWNGYTINKQIRLNLSASYTYSTYSEFDKTVRRFRNGGSFTSNLNSHYNIKDVYAVTGSFTFNRFANPQGTVRSSVSMNLGFQARFLNKKASLTLNVIDPFMQQQNRTFSYGPNFIIENFNTTRTRNIRLTATYNFTKTAKKSVKELLRK